jgi:hypothetical protein
MQQILPRIAVLLGQYWLSPDELRKQAVPILASADTDPPLVVVSGETDSLTTYAQYGNEILIITPFTPVTHNVILRGEYPNGFVPANEHYHLAPATPSLLARLRLPRVLLVNPCVLENFPVPRLCLSIGVLASYLRRRQIADVYLIDMQMGTTIEDIIAATCRLGPAIFGISISYGQKHLAINILDRVQALASADVHPRLVLGNIIPASFPKEFLQRYPDALIVTSEGEFAIAGIVEHVRGYRAFQDIPGITYRKRRDRDSLTIIDTAMGQDRMVSTGKIPVRPEDLPLPAFDTIPDLARNRGALTLELSRGCQWNACKLCPREHKAGHWKTMPANEALRQLAKYRDICDRFNITKHVFLADEEFVRDQRRWPRDGTHQDHRRRNDRAGAGAQIRHCRPRGSSLQPPTIKTMARPTHGDVGRRPKSRTRPAVRRHRIRRTSTTPAPRKRTHAQGLGHGHQSP